MKTLIHSVIIFFSALLFAFSFPNSISLSGFFPLAFFAFIFFPYVIRESGWIRSAVYGGLYGFSSYVFYNFWLATFHPLAIFIVPVIYLFFGVILFLFLKAADTLFPKYGYVIQALIWVCYEFLKTQGFLGYPYGIIGYSQYSFIELIQISDIFGVWGVSLLIALPSFILGKIGYDWFKSGTFRLQNYIPAAVGFLILFSGAIIYGLFSQVDYSESDTWRTGLVQQNVDPWHGGNRAYRESLRRSIRLSNQALREDPDIIIWSETSFVPGIDWHTRYRTDQERYLIVQELIDYLAHQDVPFVIGNDDGQLERDLETGDLQRVDYNAAILYEEGAIVDTYRKLKLVPFTESFPYEDILPAVYHWLQAADTHFWERGDEYTVFEAGGVRFSTPICYEDTFGDLNRRFVQEGAQIIANLTNDAWSHSVVAEMQHATIAVFRSVENRRSMVRSTNGGITCSIDPNGRFIDTIEPFVQAALVTEVPVFDEVETVYTRYGDWFAWLLLCVSFVLLISKSGFLIYRRFREKG
ncbi:MAG: apolipoprotein N-acyltransferase [Spirochaetia bacterium]